MPHRSAARSRAVPAPTDAADSDLLARYRTVRTCTETLCAPLAIEDHCIQTMPDVSPPKWHLAHTTWFFEQFVLVPYQAGYSIFDPAFDHLFNSYYQTHGLPFPRPQRGLLARPTVETILRYRAHVDAAMEALLSDAALPGDAAFRTVLGCHHEQQHQELLLTDIKHIFAFNPLRPAYVEGAPPATTRVPELSWVPFRGGIGEIGHAGGGFAYDNETPRHRVLVGDYALAQRPVTNGEYLAFMEDGGYARPELWLSDGWATIQREGWQAPLYWERQGEAWYAMTLAGLHPVDPDAAVCHVSFYEADAYARWAGARLPTEAEWELAAVRQQVAGRLAEDHAVAPGGSDDQAPLAQLYGDVWEWTASPYVPYPGFRPLAGTLGEYNGKFMNSQMVLRGGSIATPADHIRPTYRNFFYPGDRWQFSGIRLAKDL